MKMNSLAFKNPSDKRFANESCMIENSISDIDEDSGSIDNEFYHTNSIILPVRCRDVLKSSTSFSHLLLNYHFLCLSF